MSEYLRLPHGCIPNTCEAVDALPAAYRALVQDYGVSVVNACINSGVREPRKIRHLITSILMGARETGNRRSGIQPPFWNLLDQHMPYMHSARDIARFMHDRQLVPVNVTIPPRMVDASIAAVSRYGLLSKREKHRIRLRDALKVEQAAQFAFLDGRAA